MNVGNITMKVTYASQDSDTAYAKSAANANLIKNTNRAKDGIGSDAVSTVNISSEAFNALNRSKDGIMFKGEMYSENGINSLIKSYEEEAENSDESAKAAAEEVKYVEVARRIASGAKVPAKDERKLMEYNAKLYQAAKAAAMLAKNRIKKKYGSMFEDEEKENRDEDIRALDEEGNIDVDSTDDGSVNDGDGGANMTVTDAGSESAESAQL